MNANLKSMNAGLNADRATAEERTCEWLKLGVLAQSVNGVGLKLDGVLDDFISQLRAFKLCMLPDNCASERPSEGCIRTPARMGVCLAAC